MAESENILYCKICGFAVDTVELSKYETKPEIQSNQVVFDESEIDTEFTIYVFRKCPKCESPYLLKHSFLNHHEVGIIQQGTEQLYPSGSEQLISIESIPAEISNIYKQAKNCYEQNLPEPSIIMCRKCLEAICIDLDAKGNNLDKKIEYLKTNGKIDEKLFNWANQLRLIGNDAAHDINIKITKGDAKDSIIFLNALLLYIYTLDKKFELFKNRRKKA